MYRPSDPSSEGFENSEFAKRDRRQESRGSFRITEIQSFIDQIQEEASPSQSSPESLMQRLQDEEEESSPEVSVEIFKVEDSTNFDLLNLSQQSELWQTIESAL